MNSDYHATDEIFDDIMALTNCIASLERVIKYLYAEIDARIAIVDGMSLAGEAAADGELVTDAWLWNDWTSEEETV
jgi:hypothetical protein